MDEIQKRLEYFIANQGYNYSQFADMIGVQRSSISHIITGRNKPSYDFLQKIFVSFPELNADWLIMGRGKMFHEADDQDLSTTIQGSENQVITEESSRTGKKPEPVPDKIPPRNMRNLVKKVILLYDDDHFEEYLKQVD